MLRVALGQIYTMAAGVFILDHFFIFFWIFIGFILCMDFYARFRKVDRRHLDNVDVMDRYMAIQMIRRYHNDQSR